MADVRRARAFASRTDGWRFAIARAALRVLLAAELDLRPAAVPLLLGEHGKPRLAAESALEFNVSHCGDLAVIALSEIGPVGVDIERRYRPDHAIRVVAQCFDPYERRVIEGLAAPLRAAAFLRCWTSKEAVLKALGVGLGVPISTVVVEPDPRRPTRILKLPEGSCPSHWTLRELCLMQGRVTLAVAQPARAAHIVLCGVVRV